MNFPTQAEFFQAMVSFLQNGQRWPDWALREALIHHFKLTADDLKRKCDRTLRNRFEQLFGEAQIDLFAAELIEFGSTAKGRGLLLKATKSPNEETPVLKNTLYMSESAWRFKRQDLYDLVVEASKEPRFFYTANEFVHSVLANYKERELIKKMPTNFSQAMGSRFCYSFYAAEIDGGITYVCFYIPGTTETPENPPSIVGKFLSECQMNLCTRNILISPLPFTAEEREQMANSGRNITAYDLQDILDAVVENEALFKFDHVNGTVKLNEDRLFALRTLRA